jgi:MATE family multidrug resistance protein
MAFLPGLYIQGLADLQRRFLNNFGKNRVTFICTAVGISFHVLWSYIFVIHLGYGIIGTGISNVITTTLIFVLLLVYTNTQDDIAEAVQMPDSRVFDDMYEYFSIGIPSTIMLCLDWWVWELLILISGYLGVHE